MIVDDKCAIIKAFPKCLAAPCGGMPWFWPWRFSPARPNLANWGKIFPIKNIPQSASPAVFGSAGHWLLKDDADAGMAVSTLLTSKFAFLLFDYDEWETEREHLSKKYCWAFYGQLHNSMSGLNNVITCNVTRGSNVFRHLCRGLGNFTIGIGNIIIYLGDCFKI